MTSHGAGRLIGAVDGYFDAAVLGARCSGFRVVHRFIFAEPDHLNSIDGDVVLCDEIRYHCVGAAFAQSLVVGSITGLIGKAFHCYIEALVIVTCHHLVESLAAIGIQFVAVEFEVDGRGRHFLVVVQTGKLTARLLLETVEVLTHLVGFLACRVGSGASLSSLVISLPGLVERIAGARIGPFSSLICRT